MKKETLFLSKTRKKSTVPAFLVIKIITIYIDTTYIIINPPHFPSVYRMYDKKICKKIKNVQKNICNHFHFFFHFLINYEDKIIILLLLFISFYTQSFVYYTYDVIQTMSFENQRHYQKKMKLTGFYSTNEAHRKKRQ